MTSQGANDLVNGVLKNIDVDSISESVSKGEVDMNDALAVLQQFLSEEDIKKLVEKAKAISDSKNGEAITQQDIANVLDGIIDVDDIREKVTNGDVDVENLKSELPNLLGKEQSEKLLEKTEELAEKMQEEE